MRKVLLFLLLSTLCATAAHVQFALEDFTTQPVLNRWFMIKPLSAPGASGSAIVGQGPIYTNISAGTIIVSNMLAGTYYCVIDTEFEQTKFRITIPSTNILINASDYLSTSTAIAPGTVAYSIAASDGRFVLQSRGNSSDQTLSNPVFYPGTNGVAWSVADSSQVYMSNSIGHLLNSSWIFQGISTLGMDSGAIIYEYPGATKQWDFKVPAGNNTVAQMSDVNAVRIPNMFIVTNSATLTNTINSAPPGSGILLAPGIYLLPPAMLSQNGGTNTACYFNRKTNLTLTAIVSGQSILRNSTGGRGGIAHFRNCDGITFVGVGFEGARLPEPVDASFGLWGILETTGTNNNFKFLECYFKSNTDHAVVAYQTTETPVYCSSNFLFRACEFDFIGNTNWTGISWNDGTCIIPQGPDWRGEGCTFKDCNRVFEPFCDGSAAGYTNFGVLRFCNNSLIRQRGEVIIVQTSSGIPIQKLDARQNTCDFQTNSRNPIFVSVASSTGPTYDGFNITDNTVYGNNAQNNGSAFFYGDGTGVTNRDLLLANNTFEGFYNAIIATRANRVRVRGNDIRNIGSTAVILNGKELLVRDNYLRNVGYYAGGVGIGVYGAVSGYPAPSSNVTMRANTIDTAGATGGTGIHADSDTRNLILSPDNDVRYSAIPIENLSTNAIYSDSLVYGQKFTSIITNTVTESSLFGAGGPGSQSVSNKWWSIGKRVKAEGGGKLWFTNVASAASHTLKVVYGGTTLFSKAFTLPAMTNDVWFYDVAVRCDTNSSSGALQVSGKFQYPFLSGTNIYASIPITNGPVVLDTTASGKIDVTITPGTTNLSVWTTDNYLNLP